MAPEALKKIKSPFLPAVLAVSLLACLMAAAGAAGPSSSGGKGKLRPPTHPIRAVQVMTLECDDWDEVSQRLDRFKAAGVNAIILRVFHNPGDGYYKFAAQGAPAGVYFKTSRLPVVADVLGPFCELAQKKGLVTIAWMTSRYAIYGHEEEMSLRCMAWEFGSKKAVATRGFSPILPEARERTAEVFRDLAAYPIQGVLIQDDLMLKHTEGMNPIARKIYKAETGREADPDKFFLEVEKRGSGYIVTKYSDEFDHWRRWKNSKIIEFAERMRKEVQSARPGVPVGVNMYYETLTSPDDALTWFSQDVDAAMASNLDFYAFMFYHRQMAKELNLSTAETFDLIGRSLASIMPRVDFPQRVWVKAQTVDWDTGARVPSSELTRMLNLAKKSGNVGLAVIPAKKSLDLEALKEAYR